MEKTSLFTGDSRSELELMENPRDFSNDEYAERVDILLDILNITKKIILTYIADEPKSDTFSEEDYETFTDEELRALLIMDDIDGINWAKINKLSTEIGLGIFFNVKKCSDLFLTNLELFKETVLGIMNKINYGRKVEFQENYSKKMFRVLKNLNYCVMVSLNIFGISKNKVYIFMRDYAIKNSLNLEDMFDEMYGYYKENKPDLELFDKYPELAIAIEKIVDQELFFDLASLSDRLSREELIDIASGKILVDNAFIEYLESKGDE